MQAEPKAIALRLRKAVSSMLDYVVVALGRPMTPTKYPRSRPLVRLLQYSGSWLSPLHGASTAPFVNAGVLRGVTLTDKTKQSLRQCRRTCKGASNQLSAMHRLLLPLMRLSRPISKQSGRGHCRNDSATK